MRGQELLDGLDQAAQRADAQGAAARQLKDHIDRLGAAARTAIAAAADETAIAAAFEAAARSRISLLDAVASDGAALIAAYQQEPAPAGGAKPPFASWLQSRKQQSDAEKAKVERLEALLGEPAAGPLWTAIMGNQDVAALTAASAALKDQITRDAAAVPGLLAALAAPDGRGATAPSGHFLDFLATLEARGDKDAQELRKLFGGSRIAGKIVSGEVQLYELLSVIDARVQGWFPATRKAHLKAVAVDYFTSFHELPGAAAPASGERTVAGSGWPQWLAIGSIILGTMVIIGAFLLVPGRLQPLSEIAPARGFITFIFTVGTIALFLVITAATVFDNRSDGREQYERAKTILTMLIGIFGTVLGFYFGLSDERQGSGEFAVRPLEVASGPDGTLTLATSVNGGEPPYTFYVKVLDANGAPTDHATFVSSASGALNKSLSLADLAAKGTSKVTIAVHAEDARSTLSATETRTAQLAPPAAAAEQTASANQRR